MLTREQIVIATQPKEEVIKVFTPVEDFHDEELQSSYLKGYTYYLRKNNNALGRKLPVWLRNNKVTLIEEDN